MLSGVQFGGAGEATEVKGLDDAEVDVDHAETTDGAAEIGVEPEDAPFGTEVGEHIGLPIVAPGEEEQEEADLEAEDDVEDTREFVIPAVFSHWVPVLGVLVLRASMTARTGANSLRCCGVAPYFCNAAKWSRVP